MTINVAPRMAKKSITKDLHDQIINMIDETDGGYIIRNRQIVNPEKWQEHLDKERDRREAALAATMAINNSTAPDRNVNPSQLEDIKEEMAEFKKSVDDKFAAILEAINNK